MPQKKKKTARASDAIIRPDHIHQAQKALAEIDMSALFARVDQQEPELASFIVALSKDIAANLLMDFPLTREAARHLQERIVTLCVGVYGAYTLALAEHFGEIFKNTPLAQLDAPAGGEPAPAPPSPPPPLPPTAEEGGACVA
jgi:hypothetical protein